MKDNTENDYGFNHGKAKVLLAENRVVLPDAVQEKIATGLEKCIVTLPTLAKSQGEDIFYKRDGYHEVAPIETISSPEFDNIFMRKLACIILTSETIYDLVLRDESLQQTYGVTSYTKDMLFNQILENVMYGAVQGRNYEYDEEGFNHLIGVLDDIFEVDL